MPEYILHTVQKGDTLWGISKKYKVEEHKIVQANPEKIKLQKRGSKYTPVIYEGDVLRIPQDTEETVSYKIEGKASLGMGESTEYQLLDSEGNIPHYPSEKISWQFHVDEGSENWRQLRLAKEKTGQKFTIVFTNQKLKAKKIRIEAYFKGQDSTSKLAEFLMVLDGEDTAEIKKLELLDANRNLIKRKLSYAETLFARAQCTGMEGETLYFSLWEDDAPGAGHSKENEENFIATKQAQVVNGRAEVSFSLIYSTMAPIANRKIPAGQKDEGPYHEYYVTVTRYEATEPEKSSKNVDVNNPDYVPLPPKPKPKKKETPKTKPQAQPKKKEVQETVVYGKSRTTNHAKITSIQITDILNNDINRDLSSGESVRIHINTQQCKGEKLRIDVYDNFVYANNKLRFNPSDLIGSNEILVQQDNFYFDFPLLRFVYNPGRDLWVVVTLYKTNQTVTTTTITVDKKNFSIPKPEGINPVTINAPDKDNGEGKEKCFCNRDFEEKDVRQFVKLLKGSETIWEGQALKGGKRAECNISDKSFKTLTNELNKALKKYKINTCAQKMHFLAQICEETGTFALSEETKSQYASSTSIYKGRGILQLTGVRKNGEEKYNTPGPYQDYADHKGDQDIVNKPEIVANNVHYCIDSGAWIWSVNKKMPSNKYSEAVIKWGEITAGKSLNQLAEYVDDYLELISVLLNGRNTTTKMPNGWEKRKSNYELLKTQFFKYQVYHKANKAVNNKDIVTYHIYTDGRLEKHIPKKIKVGYDKKYKYVYCNKEGKEYDLGTYDIIPTQLYNGKKGLKINLIDLDKVNKKFKYGEHEYTFNIDSPRKFVNEKTLASFFGAMLEVNYNDISCNGFSHSDGSSKPSISHINGNNGDFKYLRKDKKLMSGKGSSLDISANPDLLDDVRQNKWNDALFKFGWKSMLGWTYKRNGKINYLNHLPKNTDNHHHHLHLQGYKPNFKEIKE